MLADCYLEHMALSKSYNDADRACSVSVYTQKWLLEDQLSCLWNC